MQRGAWARLVLLGGVLVVLIAGCQRSFEDDFGERPNQGPKAGEPR